jgi:hypothetical protein
VTRTRLGLVAAATVASVTTVGVAQAQGVDEFGTYGMGDSQESPQNFALELRFGPYTPRVDDGVPNGTPYKDVFGTSNRYLLGAELDWQILRIPKLGTLGPGFGIGITWASGDGFSQSGDRVSQESVLTLLPMYTVAVFRVDVLARDLGIPLVPYAKGGLGFVPWWSSDGGSTAYDDNKEIVARDWSYGYQFALGGMLQLDPLDPGTARNMDADTGVNSAYVFGEFYYSDIDGFGDGNEMQVGTTTWIVGIALEI